MLIHGAWMTPAGWEEVADYALTWTAQAQTASTVRIAQRDAPASVMPLLKTREEN